MDKFEREADLVKLYIDAAKSYSQVSVLALALAFFLVENTQQRFWTNWILVTGCACFLLAVLCAISYQALAVGRLESLSGLPVEPVRAVRQSWYDNAYIAYNAMALAFVLGVGCLAASVCSKVFGL